MADNALQMFDFKGHPVRVITGTGGEPWWVAKDVCDVLEHSDTSKAVSRLDDDEKGTNIVRTPSGDQGMLVINESGLYKLMIRSRKPQAKVFVKWITSEVLPSIRKTGRYEAPGATQPDSKLDTILRILATGHNDHGRAIDGLRETQDKDRRRLVDAIDEANAKIAGLESEILNISKYRQRVLKVPPDFYHRFRSWCTRRGVPDRFLGDMQPHEIGICKALAIQMGRQFRPERVHPSGNSEAWYFHERVLLKWEYTLRERYGWSPPEYLPLRDQA